MRFSKEEKAQWLEDWRKSGKKVWTYAKENGLCPQTFVRWTKLKAEEKTCFVEVPAKKIQPFQHPQEILIEKGDLRIHIPLSLGSGELRTIFNALGETA
jgi:hypothetical protein